MDAPVDWAPELDAALAGLHRAEKVWAATSLGKRRELLERVHGLVGRHAAAWVETAAGIKGLPAAIAAGRRGVDLRSVRHAQRSDRAGRERCAHWRSGGSPIDGYRLGSAPGGRVTVEVLPHNVYDQLLLSGFSAQVWMKPGVSAETVRREAGLAERNPTATNGVGVVLGAGNITSIAPLDVLYELYANNRVVALKLNPIMDALLPVYRDVFAPLIDLGVLVIVTGAADVGGYLVHHDLVDHVHITGSAASHDAIVLGDGRGGAAAGGRTAIRC